jgi:hypothetical protein
MAQHRRRSTRSESTSGVTPAEPRSVVGAVLLIGSLLWEGERRKADGHKGADRKRWREERLDMRSLKKVAVKIRYGRISPSRDNQYTMVFGGRRMGSAKFARLREPAAVAGLTERVKAEADALGSAERIRSERNPHNCADWGGVVAIAINPASTMKDVIAAAWKAQFEKVPKIRPDAYCDDVVDVDGILRVKLPWRNELAGIDYLLATPTEPNDSKANARKIARAIKDGTYFARNRTAGIITAGDTAILRAIKRRADIGREG